MLVVDLYVRSIEMIMYLCIRGIDVGLVFVLGVSMLVMYLCVTGIDVGRVFVC
jgi:hypothetical protein